MLNWLFTSPCCAMLKKIVLYRLGIGLLFLFSVSTSRSLTLYSFHQQHTLGVTCSFFFWLYI
jgi:hypothetical protein